MPDDTRELWTAQQVADHLGTTSTGSVRGTLSRLGVAAVEHRPGPSGRVQAYYDAAQVRAALAARPGRGHRSDLNAS
ncbi:hypothetical protein RM572_22060 [Streptomyces sp. DSM 42041]|uniref:Uncharacterized protein n=1 Tax=Streptomyces hazeniae TaxID=3075538 RepID=A0ABU2NWT6_9ACTN|nr:hypothetical protein [Streptomyces sp. DSM 42041]MDT0381448.1 hypothetical protein [Streptomyces sp. DSM 42041]